MHCTCQLPGKVHLCILCHPHGRAKYSVVPSCALGHARYRSLVLQTIHDGTFEASSIPLAPMADVVKIMPKLILPRIVLHSNPCFGDCGAECVKSLTRHKTPVLYTLVAVCCVAAFVSAGVSPRSVWSNSICISRSTNFRSLVRANYT